MSNYTKTTDFEAKDSLPSGDSGKIIRGSEFETEFDNISTAIATKSDTASPTFTGTVTIPTLSVTGNTTLGNAATDTVTVTADIASNLIPSADDTYDLGASGAEWNDLFIDGTANIDSLVADTADINGGTIDGVTIGGTTAGALTATTISGTTITGSGDMAIDTDTLFVDVSADRVGVNTSSPASALDVNGTTKTDGLEVDLSGGGDVEVTGAANTNTGVFVRDPTATAYGAFFGYDDANTVVHIGGVTDGTKNAALLIGRDNNIVQFGGGDVQFYEDTNTTVKMLWDASAESLGIGVTPQASLHIVNDASRTQFIASGTVGNDRFLAIDLDITGSEDIAYITCDQADSLAFGEKTNDNDRTIANEHMRIAANGNVAIGSTDASQGKLKIAGTQSYAQLRLHQNDTDNSDQRMGLTFRQYDVDEEGYAAVLGFSNTTSNQVIIGGGTGDYNAATIIRFVTGATVTTTQGTDRARITEGGHFLVGKTTQDSTNTVGFEAKDDGLIAVTTDGALAGLFNRKTSDGTIVEFRKDNSTVGSIGTISSGLYIGNSDVGIRFLPSLESVEPFNVGTGGPRDNGIDLGRSASRFKDLYLSGGAYLGGTAAANKLDDYEEGTFTPEIADLASGGNTGTATTATGRYTKVGNLVTVQVILIDIDTTGMNTGNTFVIRSMPFTSAAGNNAVGATQAGGITLGSYVNAFFGANRSYVYCRDNLTSSGGSNITVSDLTSGSADLYFTITYEAA